MSRGFVTLKMNESNFVNVNTFCKNSKLFQRTNFRESDFSRRSTTNTKLCKFQQLSKGFCVWFFHRVVSSSQSKCRIAVCSGPYVRVSNYDFQLADEIFQKSKKKVKKYDKSIIRRKTLEILSVNKCISEKKRTGSHERCKTISATNNYAPTNSTPALARARSATQQ